MKKRICRGLVMLLCAAALCAAGNILAFTIDTEDMREHTWQGCLMLGEQLSTPQTVGGFLSSQLDNYTSIMILKTAGYVGGESLLHKAFGGYRVDMPPEAGQSSWEGYCNYEFGELAPPGSLISYSRYWHGYTLPLRLLMCVLDAANTQMFLYFVLMVLFILCLHLTTSRGLGRLIPGFFLSYFLMMPFSVSTCLQYIPVTLLTLCACTALLLWDQRIGQAVTLPAFFALTGLVTNYFDLLTFPLASLCYPLILLLALRMRRGESFGALLRLTILCGFGWALGYGGMWAFKWLINALVFGWGTLASIFSQIGLRTSDNSGELSRFAVLLDNLNVIAAKKSYLLIIGLCTLASLAPVWRAVKKEARIAADARALVLLLPAAAACLWILALANHSHDHTYYTYRTMTAALFGAMAFISCLPKAEDGQ